MCSVCFRYWHLQNLYTQTICRVHPQDTLSVWQGSVCQEGVRASVIAASCLVGPTWSQSAAARCERRPPRLAGSLPCTRRSPWALPAETYTGPKKHTSRVSIEPEAHAVLCCTVSQESNLGDVGTLISHDRARTVAGGQERHQEVFLLGSADKEDEHPTKRRKNRLKLNLRLRCLEENGHI